MAKISKKKAKPVCIGEKGLLQQIESLKMEASLLSDAYFQLKKSQEESDMKSKLLDSAMDSIFIHDAEGKFYYVNEAACKTHGYTQSELMKINLHHLDVPEFAKLIAPRVKKMSPTHPISFESLHYRKDGSTFPVEVHASFITWKGERRILGVVRDISERKKAEEDIKKSKEFLDKVINAIADPVFVKDNQFRFVLVNDAEVALTGHARETQIGKTDFESYPKRETDVFLKNDKEVLRTGKENISEEHLTNAKGKTLTILTKKSLYTDSSGKKFIVGTIRDITQEREVERQLSKFKFGIERSNQVIFMTNRDGTIFYVNPMFTKTYGYSEKEAIGKTPRIIKSGTMPKKAYKPFWDTMLRKEVVSGDIVNKAKDGRLLTMRGSANPVLDDHGNIIGFMAVQTDVTEQKKTESNLIESETRYRVLVDSLPLCIKMFDPEGNLISINKHGREEHSLQKWTDAQIRNWKYLKCIQPEYRSKVVKALKSALDGKTSSFVFEHTHDHAQGGFCYSNLVPVKIDGKIQYILFSSMDVTESKVMEESLKKSEIRYRALFNSTHDAIMTLEPPSWVFTSGNPAAVKMFACKSEKDFTSRAPWHFSPPKQPDGRDSGEVAKAMIMKAMKEGSNVFEWIHRRKNGEDFPVTVLLTRMTIEGKTFLQATVRDITEQKKIQDALRQSEEQYRDIVENSTEMIHSVDTNNRILFVNRRECELLGYSAKELIGKPLTKIYSKNLIHLVAEGLERLKKEGILHVPHSQLIRKNGQPLDVEIHSIAIYGKDGKFIRTRSILIDITERQKTEQELQRKVEQMEFIGRTNLKRHKQMLEMERRIKELEEQLRNPKK